MVPLAVSSPTRMLRGSSNGRIVDVLDQRSKLSASENSGSAASLSVARTVSLYDSCRSKFSFALGSRRRGRPRRTPIDKRVNRALALRASHPAMLYASVCPASTSVPVIASPGTTVPPWTFSSMSLRKSGGKRRFLVHIVQIYLDDSRPRQTRLRRHPAPAPRTFKAVSLLEIQRRATCLPRTRLRWRH